MVGETLSTCSGGDSWFAVALTAMNITGDVVGTSQVTEAWLASLTDTSFHINIQFRKIFKRVKTATLFINLSPEERARVRIELFQDMGRSYSLILNCSFCSE